MDKSYEHLKNGIKRLTTYVSDQNGLTYVSTFVHHEMGTELGAQLKDALEKAVVDVIESWVV